MTSKRSTNFSQEEKLLLIDLISDHKNMIENKRIDSVSVREKKASWEQIERKFNIISLSKRNAATLKMCWENLKKRQKKYFSALQSEIDKTGGGLHQLSKDHVIYEKILAITSPLSFVGMNDDSVPDGNYFSRELSIEEEEPTMVSAQLTQEPTAESEELESKIELVGLAKDEAESRLSLFEIKKNTAMEQAQASNTFCKLQIKQEESRFAFLQKEAKERMEMIGLQKEEAKERMELVELQKKEAQERLELIELQKEEAKKKLEQEKVKLAILKVQLQKELKKLED